MKETAEQRTMNETPPLKAAKTASRGAKTMKHETGNAEEASIPEWIRELKI